MIGSNKKYVKINGMIAVIRGNIKLLNISFGVKKVNMQSPLSIYYFDYNTFWFKYQ